jgi:hypothetical protein
MEKLGRYQVQRKVEAANGPVYLGSEAGSGRAATLKLVRFTGEASSDKLASLWRNLHEEVRAAAVLQHPNAAQVFEVFQHEGKTWIATEVATDKNLANLLAESAPLSGDTILEVLRQAAEVLDYAHGKGLLHRTLRPAHVGVRPGGAIQVFGFGLAQYFLEAPEASSTADLAYLAPELLRGESLTGRCDQFSLAAIAYEMLTGEAPFQGSAEQIRSSIVEQDPLPADGLNPAIGPEAARVLARGLAKRPEERYGSCREFVGALGRALAMAGWISGEAPKAGRSGPVESIDSRPRPVRPDADSFVEDLAAELAGGSENLALERRQTGASGEGAAGGEAVPPPGVAGSKRGSAEKLQSPKKPIWQLEPAGTGSGAKTLAGAMSPETRKVAIVAAASVLLAVAVFSWLYFGYGFGGGEPAGTAGVAAPGFAIVTESAPPAAPATAYRHLLKASGGTSPFEWKVEGELPPGLSLDTVSGAIEGTPRAAGIFPVVVFVTDASGQQASRSLDLRVQQGLAIRTPAALPSGVVRQLYQHQLRAEGGSAPHFWELTGGSLPTGLALNSDGMILGRPQDDGTFQFRARVADATKTTAEQAFRLRVGSGLTLLSAAEMPSSSMGSPYQHQLAAGGGAPPLRWSVSGGTLPPGLTLERTSGVVQGQTSAAGRFNFEVMVQDSARASAVQAFQLEVQSALKIVTPASLPDANLSRVYAKPLELAGGNWPYRWTLAGGALPAGLQLDESSGTVRGTPSLAGNYEFDIEVRDAFRATATQRFRLAVTTMLEIQTAYDLPEASGSGAYTQTLHASGGRPPYLWKVIEGALPKDFTLDSTAGVVGGVPTTRGEYRFTVEVSDGLGTKANRLFRLSVIPALRFNDRGALPHAIVGERYTQAVEVSGGQAPHSWTVQEGALPEGVALEPTTGVVEGTPQTPGRYRFAVQVKDAKEAAARQFFELEVKPPAPGEMIWRGSLPKDGVLIIQDGRYASIGTVTGALPGVPIKIDLEPKEGIAVVTAPARANNWKVLVINASQPQSEITIRWSPLSSQ